MSREEKVVEIILEMFAQRNYTEMKADDQKIFALKPDGKKVCAFTNIIPKLKIAEIHTRIAVMETMQIKHCLLVFEGSPTPVVKDIVNKMQQQKINIELFQADELQFNITKHSLVPKHVLINRDESHDFRRRFGTSIPEILRSDPVVRFYDFKKGDILEIHRRDNFISYRIVV